MTSVNELLNKISDFNCEIDGIEIAFPGILQKENENIILNAKLSIQQYRNIPTNTEFAVLGNVSGKKITLIGSYIKSASRSMGNNNISIHIIPKEIIIGGHFSSTPVVKKLTAVIPELNYMFFGTSPLDYNMFITEENSSVLNYTFLKSINAKDKYGKLQLYQTFNFQYSDNIYKHNIASVIKYSFTVSLPLMDAVARVSAVRNLFSFFGNGYIPIGEISFNLDADEEEYELWLNYKEDVPAVNTPFLIRTSDFETQFQKIWEAWLTLYENANPIPALFYEIVCNRSTRINSFLNLSQAIEVYSSTFRNVEAEKIAKNDSNNKGKRKDIKLKHRYQDVLIIYNNALGLIESNIINYAQGFSNMRNYYTHYNPGKYVKPTYDELFAAIHILRFVLLTIIYTIVGIPLNCILECKRHSIFSEFDRDAKIMLEYSKKKK